MWAQKLKQSLIRAGTNGVEQSKLILDLRNDARAEDILAALEDWRGEGKVQRFRLKTKGRPKHIWRATTKMVAPTVSPDDDDPEIGTLQ